jgi:hypothetical protein
MGRFGLYQALTEPVLFRVWESLPGESSQALYVLFPEVGQY